MLSGPKASLTRRTVPALAGLVYDAGMHDFDAFHRSILPGRCVTELGKAAARDVAGVPPVAFRLSDGRAYRVAEVAGTIAVTAGDDAPIVVELDPSAWADFVSERATAAGLRHGGRISFVHGTPADLERWEPALRALYNDRRLLDPRRMRLDLDLARRFTLDDPPAELGGFLDDAGFLHVRGVFSREEIARLGTLVEHERLAASPDDGTSWWARRGDGTQVCCRLIYLGLRVPEIARLGDDPRLRTLAALASEPLRAALDRADGQSAVLKHADVVDGLSDLPWHRDCGLGGHPITCPTLNAGIQLDAATAASGRLLFVPGSHRGSLHRADVERGDVPIVAIDTEPGDVTLHFGDVLHAAPPPTSSDTARRALYVTFMPERAFETIPKGHGYNDIIRPHQAGRPTE